ncbi:MAG: nucleotidyltransferase domain-containing protein [Firmicutes bacterium]|nr:nucleotidyltransferase domain-containing protein [Bacillota bacterium]HHX26746.1 nucleotidyltransferase domain-containing protein [Bacillota bacterium]
MGFRMPQAKERKEMLDDALQQFLGALPATNVELVIHFGSHARGSLKSRSDIDLIVVRPTEKPFVHRADDLTGLFPPGTPVDLLVYTPEEWAYLSVNRGFHKQALEEGSVVYDARR